MRRTGSPATISRRARPSLRRRANDMSAPAAGVLWQCVKTRGGEFTCVGGGFGNERSEEHSFRYRGVSGSDPGPEPRPAGDIVRRISDHLRRDVPVPANIAVGDVAAL